MRQRLAVRPRAIARPARRGAGRRDYQRDPERNLAVIFEPAEHPRPAGPQKFRVADLFDDLRGEVAAALGLLRQGADLRHHRARPLDELVGRGDREAADRGSRHRARIPRGAPAFRAPRRNCNARQIAAAIKLPAGLPGARKVPLPALRRVHCRGSILGRAIVEDGRGRRKLAFTSMSPRGGNPPPRATTPRGVTKTTTKYTT